MTKSAAVSELIECFRFYYDKRSELKYKWLTNSEITAAFTYFLGSEECLEVFGYKGIILSVCHHSDYLRNKYSV